MNITVRPMSAGDLDNADRIMRLAFGTFNGLEDPSRFMGDGGFVRPRWHADPSAAFSLDVDGRLVGSNFIGRWGSFAFIGPLSIHPDYWGNGLAHHLMAAVTDAVDRWGISCSGLFTFPHSLKHVGLYQKHGFRPRMLTTIFQRQVAHSSGRTSSWSGYAGLDDGRRAAVLNQCRQLTRSVFNGLDVTVDIISLYRQKLGDTVLLWDKDGGLAGFAVCHCGPGSEGGGAICYVKFAAVAPGGDARLRFLQLVNVISGYACDAGAINLVAGVNASRHEAYDIMIDQNFELWRTGIAMHRPNLAGFCRPDVFVIDDWR